MDHSMHHHAASMVEASTMSPLLMTFTGIFLTMSVYYIVRMFFPERISACCGFASFWNEAAHSLCGLGMVAMLVPPLFAHAHLVYGVVFLVIAVGYALALSYDTLRPTPLWKVLHMLIYCGMSYMFFMPLIGYWLIDWFFICIYMFVTLFFGKWLIKGLLLKQFHPFAIGTDVFHVLMSGTMVLMFLFPAMFMSGHLSHMG